VISGGVARDLDRLSRRAHRFHRFAHHPLCDRYAGERVQLGKVRLCRGCTFAVTGGLVGGFVGLAIGASESAAAIAMTIATALLLGTLWSKRKLRIAKTWTRLVPAGLYALAITCGVLASTPLGIAIASASAAIVVLMRVLYGKRGADRTPCTTCPELGRAPCSGFARIVSRELAFRRVADRRLRDEAERVGVLVARADRRRAHRAVALAAQPVLEVAVVQPDDAAHFEDGQRIGSATGHVAAPTLRASERESDAFPGLDEIRH
jgi:hypothetical protein